MERKPVLLLIFFKRLLFSGAGQFFVAKSLSETRWGGDRTSPSLRYRASCNSGGGFIRLLYSRGERYDLDNDGVRTLWVGRGVRRILIFC